MNLRQLEVFQAVMQTGNMSAAARLVCITPSAVSKTIAHAELQLGYKLFTRHKGALAPTPEATVLFGESTEIHGRLEELRKIAANLRQTGEGQLRLAAIPSISHEFLPLVLQQHTQRHPRMRVEVRTLHQLQFPQALLTRAVDFALGFYPDPHPQVVSQVLASGPMYAAVTREVWQRSMRVRRGNPMEVLATAPLIRLVGEDPMRGAIDALAQRLGSSEELGVQVQTSRLALEMVRLGMGWTVVDFLTASNLAAQDMVAVELPELPAMPLCTYHASAWPPGQHAQRMLQLLPDLLRQAVARTRRDA